MPKRQSFGKIYLSYITNISRMNNRDELLACESDYNLLKGYSVEETKNRLFKRNFLPAPAWIADKRLFEEYGLFLEDTRLIEDYPYWISILPLHQYLL